MRFPLTTTVIIGNGPRFRIRLVLIPVELNIGGASDPWLIQDGTNFQSNPALVPGWSVFGA